MTEQVRIEDDGRQPRAGERWRLYFADIGEAVAYCPECAEREFGDLGQQGVRQPHAGP